MSSASRFVALSLVSLFIRSLASALAAEFG